jgi:hypothetical protein
VPGVGGDSGNAVGGLVEQFPRRVFGRHLHPPGARRARARFSITDRATLALIE